MKTIETTFDKATAEAFSAAIIENRPITPPSGGRWADDDLLMLAGVCEAFLRNAAGVNLQPRAADQPLVAP